jgi:hypothetical protein
MFGRIRQGWELTKKSWSVVRAHPTLLRLPLTGGAIAIVIAMLVAGPGLLLSVSDDDAQAIPGYVLIAVGAYLASFVVIYYNVILAAAANDALTGREPDLAAARSVARSRIGAIASWALIGAVVSVLLSVLRDKAGAFGNSLGSLGAAAWGFITFFVVPVLALEGIGPVEAIKRSATLVRSRWGEQVTGNVVIGGAASLVTFVGVLIGVLGGVMLVSGSIGTEVAGGVLLGLGILIAIGGAVVAGATKGVFGVALYHFSADHQSLGPFTESELVNAAS